MYPRSESPGTYAPTITGELVATDLWLGSDGVAATVSQAIGTAPDDIESQAPAQSASGRSSQPDEIADLTL